MALACALAAGAPAAAKVSVAQSPSAYLASGSTYAWPPVWGLALGDPAPAVVNEITARQLQTATDAALSAKGFRQVEDPAAADLIVTYRVITAQHTDGDLEGLRGPGPFGVGPSDYRLKTSQKMQGTLVLDLIERRTGRLVYRATSERDVGSKDAAPARLNSVLREMTKALTSQ
jgi:hypothetical protein